MLDRMTDSQLIKHCLPVVLSNVRRFRRWRVPNEDLIQEGNMAAVLAYRKWKPDAGANVRTWVSRPVWQAMWKYVRIIRSNGLTPVFQDADALVKSTKSIKRTKSLDAKCFGDSEASLYDLLGEFQEPPDFLQNRNLYRAFDVLTPRSKDVMSALIRHDNDLGDVAKEMGTSRQNILQIYNKAIAKLRIHYACV